MECGQRVCFSLEHYSETSDLTRTMSMWYNPRSRVHVEKQETGMRSGEGFEPQFTGMTRIDGGLFHLYQSTISYFLISAYFEFLEELPDFDFSYGTLTRGIICNDSNCTFLKKRATYSPCPIIRIGSINFP